MIYFIIRIFQIKVYFLVIVISIKKKWH